MARTGTALETAPAVALPPLDDDARTSYAAFGYARLPGVLSDVTDDLFAEAAEELGRAYPDTSAPPSDEDGRQGYFLPAMVPRTPVSLALVASLEPWARALLGVESVVPVYADLSVFFGPTPWHTDIGMPVPFVKLTTYEDALDADTGALRFVPGSHRDPLCGDVRSIVRRLEVDEDLPVEDTVHAVPHVVVDTDPGDVVAISGTVWHATIGGRRRVQWSLPFVSAEDADLVGRFFRSFVVDSATRGHDGHRFPFYSEHFLATGAGRRIAALGGAEVARARQHRAP